MEQKAIALLNDHRIMAIATSREDGWPQATLISYANEGLLIYFAISRSGQKFANLQRDNRVSFALGRDFHDPATIRGLSVAAEVSEVRDPKQRQRAISLLLARHPGLKKLDHDKERTVVMRANCKVITIVDYSKGFGHADVLTVGPGALTYMAPARTDDWGFGTTVKPLS